MTAPTNVDPRLAALQTRLAAKGASVPATNTVEELTEQLKEARATLRQHHEQTEAEIKQIEDEAAKVAEPVETYIVELERRIREAKKSGKSKSIRPNDGLRIFSGLRQ